MLIRASLAMSWRPLWRGEFGRHSLLELLSFAENPIRNSCFYFDIIKNRSSHLLFVLLREVLKRSILIRLGLIRAAFRRKRDFMKNLIVIFCINFIGITLAHSAKLAEREVLEAQLLSVDTGMDEYLQRHMYPFILKEAGREFSPAGILMVFEKAERMLFEDIQTDHEPQKAA